MKTLNKTLLASAIFAGIASTNVMAAEAYPDFTINPSILTSSSNTGFTADKIVGGYVETANFSTTSFTDAANFSGTFSTDIRWNAGNFFANEGVTNVVGTGINNDYQLYALFNGLTGSFNTVAGVTTFNFASSGTMNLLLDTDLDTTFSITDTSVTGGNATDILLMTGTGVFGQGTLDPSLSTCGTSGVINCGSFGATTSIALDPTNGAKYFTAPNPFYPLAFEAGQFNNFDPASKGPQFINGSMDVKFGNIPEPTSLALMGLGILGLSFVGRKKAK